MSALASAQRDFLASLLREEAPAQPGLAVYRRTMFANLEGALAAAYPVTRRLVGQAFFSEAARRQVQAAPSRSGDLAEYGASFAAFLGEYGPAAGLPYLPDVARLEWALHESHRAADAPALDFTALARVEEARQADIRFSLQPAARLLASPHPVLAIWEANQPGRDGAPERLAGPDHVLVRRVDLAARPELLEAAQWELLRAFAAGATLGEAGEVLADPAALAPALARFAADGVFCAFELRPAR